MIEHVPAATPVATPLELTVAVPVAEDDQFTVLAGHGAVPPLSFTVAVNWAVEPTEIDVELGETVTEVSWQAGVDAEKELENGHDATPSISSLLDPSSPIEPNNVQGIGVPFFRMASMLLVDA